MSQNKILQPFLVIFAVRTREAIHDTEATPEEYCAHRTDDLYDLFPLHDLIFRGRYIPDLYDLAHVAGWKPYLLHDLVHGFFVWIFTLQILRNIS